MTATGKCHKCDKIAYSFHYTKPREETPGKHEGYWYCEEHGPLPPPLPDPEVYLPKRPEYGDGLNRKQRREILRKRAKEQRRKNL